MYLVPSHLSQACLWYCINKKAPICNLRPSAPYTVVQQSLTYVYGPQLYGSPDYTDPILSQINDIYTIFDVH